MSLITKELPSRAFNGVLHRGGGLPSDEKSTISEEADSDPSTSSAVVIIDPRLLIRECMATCLGALIDQSVRTYANLSEWAADAADLPRTVLILACLDERRTIAEQIEQIEQDLAKLASKFTLPPLVFLSEEEDIGEIVGALDSGARGYIPTSVSLEVAVEALNLVRAGGVFVPASILLSAKRMLKSISTEERSPLSGIFTERQAAVVRAIRQGKANKMIAYELNMHESTVKVHVRNIMKKLKAQNRTQVAYLTQHLFRNAGS